MEFKHIDNIEKATQAGKSELFRLGIGLIFIVGIMLYASTLDGGRGGVLLVIAAMIGGYMAMNIGANDVANNVGPAVGSQALTLGGALFIAAVFEAAGAIIAGGEVVTTIRSGIINPGTLHGDSFVWLMMAALLAGAIWLNVATAVGAPVSTTHSIVGAILGAGVAAAGFDIVNWGTMGTIAASWVISPVLGGLFAAGFLYLIKRSITYQQDMVAAAVRMVPILVGLMAATFTAYLMLKGLNKLWKISFMVASLSGIGVGVLTFAIVRPVLAGRAHRIVNSKEGVNALFTVPLIFSAALLSFAHGANDVANAIGPLAAIADVLGKGGDAASKAAIPSWVMIVGAVGISLGLWLYGPKVIRTVGSEITELDKMRAYCIAMAATITVIVASQLGLPVSSTHIAVGGVFGVGFLREYLKANYARMEDEIRQHHPEGDLEAINAFLARFKKASVDEKGRMVEALKMQSKLLEDPAHFSKFERKGLRRVYRKELVKRSQLIKIAAAWIITVPASALMAAMVYFMIRGMLV